MVTSIIEKIKTGSIKTVELFGNTAVTPKPPYVMVKPETGAAEGARQFRIIVHYTPDMYDELSKYIFKELTKLLIYDEETGGKVFFTNEAGTYRLYQTGYTDVMTDASDNTIFMERLFQQPFRSGGSI